MKAGTFQKDFTEGINLEQGRMIGKAGKVLQKARKVRMGKNFSLQLHVSHTNSNELCLFNGFLGKGQFPIHRIVLRHV